MKSTVKWAAKPYSNYEGLRIRVLLFLFAKLRAKPTPYTLCDYFPISLLPESPEP